ncbi:MAG: hypothetical protein MUE52_10080 [Tabrizicola sp.]|nr:hypothetical protein [Tabrizicola sp.]
MKHALYCLSLVIASPALADTLVTGVIEDRMVVAHHDDTMARAVFFPATGGTRVMMGENAVFYGVAVAEGATPEPGPHPTILLSHGWGGNYKRMGWLISGLVERGAVVIAVNHPNSTTGEQDSLRALDHWTRAQDLSAALDQALDDPKISPLIDTDRIYALGFSYGGWTALSLGGLRGNRDGLDRFCSDPATPISHCADILRAGIHIADIDATWWNSVWKDPRISAVGAIDPALTWGLTAEDSRTLDVPVLLIGLGSGTDRLLATDTSSTGSGFETQFPKAEVLQIVPATHFTALGLCKPEGAEILADEGDDPVCTDPKGTERSQVTKRIIDAVAAHFRLP